ncbi:MAG: hypothetical protein LC676_09195 [Loktanella sp.]|nr:hypothetical protein [Loktanella sp.]
MKNISPSILALVAAIGLAIPTAGQTQQQTTTQPFPGETAQQFATRIDACNGGRIQSARFDDGRSLLGVRCDVGAGMDTANGITGEPSAGPVAGMSGGLGAGAVAGIAATAIAIAVVAGSGGGSSTPSTN